jgi:uncharacterized membrane protein
VIAGQLSRATLIGAATGCRSLVGVGTLAIGGRRIAAPGHRAPRFAIAAASAAELVLDKLPATPSRLRPAGLVPRLGLGALSAAIVFRRSAAGRASILTTAVVAGLGAAAALGVAHLGARWRDSAAQRWGSDLPGALIEDAVALGAAIAATVRT